MNEGHAGFLGLERIREYMHGDGLDFDTALAVVRASTVFTTHTPVPAGIDRFPVELVHRYFADDSGAGLMPGVPVGRVLLGSEPRPTPGGRAATAESSTWPIWDCGWRSVPNGVSQLHGRVSRSMFEELWPGFEAARFPSVRSPTGCTDRPGRHRSGWNSPAIRRVRPSRGASRGNGSGSASLDAGHIWSIRCLLRAKLVADVRRRLRGVLAAARRDRDRIGLDPRGVRSRRADRRVRTPGAHPTSG